MYRASIAPRGKNEETKYAENAITQKIQNTGTNTMQLIRIACLCLNIAIF